ncbi:hypothetical protein GCM10010094_14310 [Streptomyces flaveus]|uniref:Uncharacterized protein n=1 Tax=Streptomyces flaveus TaxID=66370 RepID=A0A917QLI4_9ACTN|nr:hypothetical protein [Streptomyces flaveus]GGK54989.1 hypothetical protein GCM10010094_14310 [Streptomyces flaveus]
MEFKALAYGGLIARAEVERVQDLTVEGMPTCVAKQVTRPVRNREATAAEQPIA